MTTINFFLVDPDSFEDTPIGSVVIDGDKITSDDEDLVAIAQSSGNSPEERVEALSDWSNGYLRSEADGKESQDWGSGVAHPAEGSVAAAAGPAEDLEPGIQLTGDTEVGKAEAMEAVAPSIPLTGAEVAETVVPSIQLTETVVPSIQLTEAEAMEAVVPSIQLTGVEDVEVMETVVPSIQLTEDKT